MDSWRLFCDVARYHSFSAAAAEHGITQPAASQKIRALEEELGASLIDRSCRPLALTPAGDILLKELQYLIQRYDSVAQKISALGKQLSGNVHVTAIYSAGIELLSQAREAFESKHDRVSVHVKYVRPDDVYDAVRHGECDFGIVSYPKTWRGVGIIPLRDEPMAVVCKPDHPLAQRDRVHASELGDWPMVSFEQGLPVGRHVKQYLRSHGSSPTITNQFDNIDTLKNAVDVTDHFAILPKRTVRKEQASGSLAVVPLEPELMRPMGIIYRRHNGHARDFSPAVEAFVDYLLEHAGPEAEADKPAAPARPSSAHNVA